MDGTGSSDFAEPDFESLIGRVQHMRDPPVSDSKSGKVRVRKVRGSGFTMDVIDSSHKVLLGRRIWADWMPVCPLCYDSHGD
jgi:hypothetical protein